METESNLGSQDYVAALRRRGVLAFSIAVPIILIAVIFAVALPSVYTASAVFRLREGDPNRTQENYVDRYVSGLAADALSEKIRREIVAKVTPYPDIGDKDAAAGMLSNHTQVNMVTEQILDPGSGTAKEINTGFSLTYENNDPKIAYNVASMLVAALVKGSQDLALKDVNDQRKFFSDEADRVRLKISELEGKVADFQKENFDQLPETAQTNLAVRNQTEQELTGIERDISAQQQNRIFLMQQRQTAMASGPGANLALLEDEYKRKVAQYDESHPDMIALRRQIQAARAGAPTNADGSLQTELKAQRSILAQARLRYSEDHPDIRRLTSNIASLEARIAAGERNDPGAVTGSSPVVVQLNTQIHAIDTQISSMQARRIELRLKLSNLEGRLASTPQVQRQYEVLNRDLGTSRQQYEGLLNEKLKTEVQAAAIVAGTANKFDLISPPALPAAPSKPSRIGIVVIGAIAAIALAFMAALTAEFLDGTVRGSRDVMAAFAVSPLAMVPEIRNSAFKRRRMRHIATFATCVLVGIPVMYFIVSQVV